MASVGRNEPCPCGSGRRYKLCHGRIEAQPRPVGFVVAGTQKGGTSALETYLREHPEICMPKDVKEVHYFDDDTQFASDVDDYAAYHGHFQPRPWHKLLGDATPIYMYWEPVAQRIHRYNPAMKFIMLLRNPVSRAYSHWNMEVKKRREPVRFEEAVRTERERLRVATPLEHRRRAYTDRGFYSAQLRRIWAHFPVAQTLVLKSEAFHVDPEPALARIAAFLGVGAFPRTDRRDVYVLPYSRPMSGGARDYLRETFAGEIDELERMLGWDLADWRSEM
ncbi:MAG: sulfotransferase domain-containing protein [Betaproteobacteria bacterium]